MKTPFKVSMDFGAKPSIVDANGNVIATVGTPFTAKEEDAKIARLLAAAPEMLGALEELSAIGRAGIIERREPGKSWYALDEVKRIAGSAIAKAKGETEP